MNRIFSALALLAVLAIGAHAAAPTYAATDAVYEWYIDETITVDDTLTAAADTVTIKSNLDIEEGWQYLLYRNAFTGTAGDSVASQVVVESETGTGTTIYSTAVDSFTTAAGEAIDLSVGGTVFGAQADIHVIAYTGVGTQAIMPTTFYIVKRRPINLTRKR